MYRFVAQVVIDCRDKNPHGLPQPPEGEGFSPYLKFSDDFDQLPVRFLDFSGELNTKTTVSMITYHGLDPSEWPISIGTEFELTMGPPDYIVGRGTISSLPVQVDI